MTFFKRHRITIILIAIALLIAGAVAIYFINSKPPAEKAAAAPAKPALTVTTARPEPVSLPVKLSANGNIAAWQEAIIGSEAAGLRLTEVRANVGDRVTKGQVLAVFALESVQAEVAQTRASLAEAEATALDAAGNAAKARTLQASGALSEQQINQYLTLEKTAKARLEAARATLTVQQVRLRQTRLLAPDNGIISARSATVGAVVGAGTELFRMIRGGRLEWRAEVTSAELARIRTGTPVTLVAANGAEVNGKTRMVGPTVDPQTRSALVYVDLPAAADNNPFKAGMFARGEFELGSTNALTLPQRAIVVRDGFNHAFVLGDDNRVRQVKLQTGRLAGDRIEILSGLGADARVAVDGAGFLNDGDLVRVNDKQP
ncbi:MAG: efflux transporter periplasmic adaptor subunit [Polaromonas sp.]|nr:efflux transporter periplasmic adaptor subunit [Polaromonas sp.]